MNIPLRNCLDGCNNFRGTVDGVRRCGCQVGPTMDHHTISVISKMMKIEQPMNTPLILKP